MIKRFFTLLLLSIVVLQANAQFEQGKKYIGASVSGLGLSYSKNEDFRIGLDAEMGYFLSDCVLLKGNIGYEHTQTVDDIRAGISARYFIIQNGVFLGTGAEYTHSNPSANELKVPIELGYCFFINGHLTIEPSIYYKMSTQDFKGNSTVGFRVGMGFIF